MCLCSQICYSSGNFTAPSSSSSSGSQTILDVSHNALTELNQTVFEPVIAYFIANNFTNATGSSTANIKIDSSKEFSLNNCKCFGLELIDSNF